MIRHSRAQRCRIVLARDREEVSAEIADDGQGKSAKQTTGSGHSGLNERVGSFGGHVEAGPLPDGGFRLSVSLPVRSDAAEARR